MPNWFDVLEFFMTQIPGSDIGLFGVAHVTEEMAIEVDVAVKTDSRKVSDETGQSVPEGYCLVENRYRWEKARMFSDRSTLHWFVEYPLDSICTVIRVIDPKHNDFLENALLGLIEMSR